MLATFLQSETVRELEARTILAGVSTFDTRREILQENKKPIGEKKSR